MSTPSAENAQEMFKSLLRDKVAPMLRAHGWKGSGPNYNRSSDPYSTSINFQKNRYNTKDEVEFTVNLAVLHDGVIGDLQMAQKMAREQWGRDTIVVPTWGIWRARLGDLLPMQRYWWRLLTGRSPERTTKDVLSAFSDFALPAVNRQLERPRIEPSFIIERRGSLVGEHRLANGDIRWHNVGGERLYPVDALLDFVDREYVFSERAPVPNIPVELHMRFGLLNGPTVGFP